jgi:diguanylate cyclase (GGDEF)-like protein/PAS domain S-box-containing protein
MRQRSPRSGSPARRRGKKADRQLLAQSTYLNTLIENSPLAIVVLNAHHLVEMVNPEFERLFLYRQSEIVGTNLDELIAPEELVSEAVGFTRRVLAGETVHGTTRRQRKDGTVVDIDLRGVPLLVHGKVIGVYGIYEEITQRQQAEEALRKSEQQFRSLFQSSPDAIFVEDLEGNVLDVNPAACRLHGLEREVLIGRNVLELVPENERERVARDFPRQAMGELDLIEGSSLTANGTAIPVEIRCSPIEFSGRRAVLFQVRDITERKRAEAALRQSEERLNTILDNTTAVVYLTDTQGRFLFVNRHWEKLFHRTKEQVAGKSKYEFFPPEIVDALLANDQKVLEAQIPLEFEEVIPEEDGLHTYISIKFPMFDSAGVPYAVCGISTDITDRKRAEHALEASEVRYRRLFETAKDGILLLDAETGQITDANPFLMEMLGYSYQELMGKKLWEIGAFKDIEASQIAFRELQEKEYIRYEDLPLQTKGGRRLEVEFVSNVYPVDNKKVIQCNIRDITERKKAEAAIRESEAKFRALTESAGCAIFISRNDKFGYANKETEVITGYTRDELLTMNTWDVIHPDFRAFVRGRRDARLRGEAVPSRYEFKIVTKSGEERWIDYSAAVIEFEGKPAVLGTAFDITRRKQAEAEILHLATAVEQSADGVLITDVQGKIQYLNPAFTKMTGFTREEVLGQSTRMLKSGKHDQQFYQQLWETILAGQTWQGEMINRRKDGTLYTEEMTVTPVRNERGEITSFIAIKQDIGERKRAEAALEQSQTRLELLNSTSARIISGMPVEQVIERTVEALGRYFQTFRVSFSTIDEQDKQTVIYSAEPPRMAPLAGRVIDLSRAQDCLATLRRLEPIIVADVAAEARMAPLRHLLSASGTRAVLGVPLPHPHKLLGLLCFESPELRPWSEHEIATLLEIAEYLSIALKDAHAENERKLAVEALREISQNLQAIIETSPVPIMALDPEGKVKIWNPAAERVFGWNQTEVLARDLSTVPTEKQEEHRMLRERVLRGETLAGVEIRRQKKDGSPIDLSLSAAQLRSPDGSVNGIMSVMADISERKRAEAALQASEERYRTLAEAAHDAIFVIGRDGRVQYVNSFAAQLFGRRAEEIIGRRRAELFSPEVSGQQERSLREVFETAAPLYVEAKTVFPRGEVWLGTWLVPLREEGGAVSAVLGISRDISVRKAAEEALQRTEEQYRSIFENAIEGIYQSTPDGHFVSANPALARMYGYGSPEELMTTVTDIGRQLYVDPNQRAAFKQRLETEGVVRDFIYQVLRRDGSVMWLAENARAVRGESGQVVYYEGTCEDITARKQADEAVARLAFIVESSQDAIVGKTLEGTIVSWNTGAEKMFGYSAEEIKGKPIAVLLPSDRSNEMVEIFERIKRGEHVDSYETVRVGKNGKTVDVSLTVSPIKDAAGCIVGASSIARDITEHKRLEAKLVHLANHDPLTDLFNRRHFQEELYRQLAEARRYGTRGALLFLDLDQFKDINDSLGHLAGDQLLTSLAGLFRERLRETDIIARPGGDEFAVLLPHTDAQQAKAVAEHLLGALRRHTMVVGEKLIGVTASIGIVLLPEHGITVGELFARADLALYQAKENGRNRYALFSLDKDWQAKIESRLGWQKRLREALEKDLFVLDAQPVLHLGSNRISQYELLLRLVGDGGEIVHPGAFLDAAERFGLMQEIDRRVVQRAIRLIASHQRTGRELRLEVNLSSKAFADMELLPLIKRELAETSVNPASLVLEIPETVATANIHQAEKFVRTLKALGCQFALDDFGTGFSSFYHLKYLPVDYLKIDGSFIENLLREPLDQDLVKAMVGVARGLGKKTIAEFVGDQETVDLLRDYGVDYAQGYHIGRSCSLE